MSNQFAGFGLGLLYVTTAYTHTQSEDVCQISLSALIGFSLATLLDGRCPGLNYVKHQFVAKRADDLSSVPLCCWIQLPGVPNCETAVIALNKYKFFAINSSSQGVEYSVLLLSECLPTGMSPALDHKTIALSKAFSPNSQAVCGAAGFDRSAMMKLIEFTSNSAYSFGFWGVKHSSAVMLAATITGKLKMTLQPVYYVKIVIKVCTDDLQGFFTVGWSNLKVQHGINLIKQHLSAQVWVSSVSH